MGHRSRPRSPHYRWLSTTAGEAGDPVLRLEMGRIFAKEGSFFQSEPHFHAAIVPPTVSAEQPAEASDAAKDLGAMMADWLEQYASGSAAQHKEKAKGKDKATPEADVIQRVEAGRFALRGLLLLLIAGKVPAAHAFLKSFIQRIIARPACKNLPLPTGDNPKSFSAPAGISAPARKVAPPGESASSYTQPLWITANADINFAQMCLGLVDCAWRTKGEADGLARSERGAAPVPEALRNAWIAMIRQYMKEGVAGNVDQIVAEVSPAVRGPGRSVTGMSSARLTTPI